MGVHHIMFIIKISKKRIFNRPNFPGANFHFRRCLIILGGTRWNHLIVLGLAVSLADAFPPMIMEFPHAIQMTSRAARLGLPKHQVVENRCEIMHKKRRECLPLKSPEHR